MKESMSPRMLELHLFSLDNVETDTRHKLPRRQGMTRMKVSCPDLEARHLSSDSHGDGGGRRLNAGVTVVEVDK